MNDQNHQIWSHTIVLWWTVSRYWLSLLSSHSENCSTLKQMSYEHQSNSQTNYSNQFCELSQPIHLKDQTRSSSGVYSSNKGEIINKKNDFNFSLFSCQLQTRFIRKMCLWRSFSKITKCCFFMFSCHFFRMKYPVSCTKRVAFSFSRWMWICKCIITLLGFFRTSRGTLEIKCLVKGWMFRK